MKKLILLAVSLMFVFACSTDSQVKKLNVETKYSKDMVKVDKKMLEYKPFYPNAERIDSKYTLHGVEITDYYSWLENSDDPKVKAWTNAENEYSEKVIKGYPQTAKLMERLKKLWNYDKMDLPVERGGKIFYEFTRGLENQAVLYMDVNGQKDELVNPNKINSEGTTAMDWWSVSPSGKYVVYGLSENGSEQSVLHVIDTETKTAVDAPIPGCRYASVGWKKDESGFFYSRKMDGNDPKEIDMLQSIRFHKLGDNFESDAVVAKSTIKEAILVSTIDPDGNWLLIFEYKGSSGKAKVLLYDINEAKMKTVVDNYDNIYEGEVYRNNVYLKTAQDNALNWKIMKVNADTLEWSTLVPEHDSDVISNFGVAAGRMLVVYMHDVASKIKFYNLDDGKAVSVGLPVLGSIDSVSADPDGAFVYFKFSSYAYPPTIFKYSEGKGLKQFWQANVGVDCGSIETKQVFFASKDGTKVPMFLVYKKGLELNGNNPVLIKGYGGFNVTYPLYFSSSNVAWIEQGGVLAIANIRGGGEYGEKWHRAGMMENKQNTFDDFAWAIKYLISEKYTNPDRVAIWGGSNGGLLTGAMVVQYPELFKAALVAVPLLDMLKFDKFLIGRYWVSEYGTADDPEQFKYIYKYSPYQNVKSGVKYPAVFLTAGESDSRVHPMHAKKMAALLQYENKSDNPIFLRVEMKAGHGQGKSVAAAMEEVALEYGFFMNQLNMEFKDTEDSE